VTSQVAETFEDAFASEEFILDPYPTYERLLREAPVWRSPSGRVFVSSHSLVSAILRDHERFPQPEDPNPSFHAMNPPEHTRLRRLVSSAFTARATERIRERIVGIVSDLVAAMPESGDIDLMSALSVELPTRMITGMLGVPLSDGELWEKWANQLHHATAAPRFLPEQEAFVAESRALAKAAAIEEQDYFRRIVRERMQNPGDDMISELGRLVQDGDRLTEDELVITLVLLLGGGHHTSINLISSCVYWLLRYPAELAKLRAEPELLSSAVEETIRFDTTLQSVDRLTAVPVELGGIQVEAGSRVTVLMAAANRDPEVFENPQEFRIDRTDARRYLSFGLGAHFCLGAPLARAEGQEAVRGLLARYPTLGFVPDDPPTRDGLYTLRGFSRVPVRLG
jgi:cytochrome P450